MHRAKPRHFRNRVDMADKVQVRVIKRRLRLSEPELNKIVDRVGNSIAAISKEVALRKAVGVREIGVFRPQQRRRTVHQCDDDRRGQQRLRHDHCRWREQQPGGPERPGARQQQIKRKPDHDGRQAEKRVGQHDDRLSPAKSRDRKPRAKGRADRQRDDARGQADPQRQRHDAEQFGVETANQRESGTN